MASELRENYVATEDWYSARHWEAHNNANKSINARADVKRWGALGDGSTDDTAAIAAARSAVSLLGGGEVIYPTGTYISGTQTIYSKVHDVGQGARASVIKRKASTNAALFKGENYDSLAAGNTVAGVYDWGLHNLSLLGNSANNSSGHGIQVYGYRPWLSDVDVSDFNNNGGYFLSFTASDPISTFSKQGSFIRAHFHDNGDDGLFYNGPHDTVFVDCWFFYNGQYGLQLDVRGSGNKFIACHSYGNAQNSSVYIDGANNRFHGCTFEGSDSYLAVCAADGDGATFDDCHFYAAGTQTTKAGVQVNGAAFVRIRDCDFENLTDGAIVFTSDGGSCLVEGNDIYATSGAAITGTLAATTIVRNNRVSGGATGGQNSAATIASGVLTPAKGHGLVIVVSGEGSAADNLDNMVIEPAGTVKYLNMAHEITIRHNQGSSPKLLNESGASRVVPQFAGVAVVSNGTDWLTL